MLDGNLDKRDDKEKMKKIINDKDIKTRANNVKKIAEGLKRMKPTEKTDDRRD